jgi:hypothetical protein
LVTPGGSQVSSEPFDEQIGDFPLETRVRFRRFRANAGEVTVRGTVVYFDDNEQMELPIRRPQVVLFLETPTGEDIEIASTFADARDEYILENLTNPELNDGSPRDLYVLVRFKNDVLSIMDRRRNLYELRSNTVRNVPDGETIIDLSLDKFDKNRGVGHIFNAGQRAHQFLRD